MSKHTPGPWINCPSTARGAAPGKVHVCYLTEDRGYELLPQTEANARLIAAAPELLEALRLCHLALGTSERSWGAKQERIAAAFAAATDAIAKAEGK